MEQKVGRAPRPARTPPAGIWLKPAIPPSSPALPPLTEALLASSRSGLSSGRIASFPRPKTDAHALCFLDFRGGDVGLRRVRICGSLL